MKIVNCKWCGDEMNGNNNATLCSPECKEMKKKHVDREGFIFRKELKRRLNEEAKNKHS